MMTARQFIFQGRASMATYSIGELGRRELLMMSAVLVGAGMVGSVDVADAATKLQPTPDQGRGPFFPLEEPAWTSDLTRVPGRSGRARGQVINVMGQVLNLSGEPVPNAGIEVWQANSHGRYRDRRDTNPAPLDPNFEGSALLVSDGEGRYRFKTIKPAAYRAGPDLIRPAHIHFQVTGRRDRLVTQMYFENDPYNATDPILNSAPLKQLLIRKMLDPAPGMEADSKMVIFDIVVYRG
jgi:protocatechuate 3,4-dioxygenase beta subunit